MEKSDGSYINKYTNSQSKCTISVVSWRSHVPRLPFLLSNGYLKWWEIENSLQTSWGGSLKNAKPHLLVALRLVTAHAYNQSISSINLISLSWYDYLYHCFPHPDRYIVLQLTISEYLNSCLTIIMFNIIQSCSERTIIFQVPISWNSYIFQHIKKTLYAFSLFSGRCSHHTDTFVCSYCHSDVSIFTSDWPHSYRHNATAALQSTNKRQQHSSTSPFIHYPHTFRTQWLPPPTINKRPQSVEEQALLAPPPTPPLIPHRRQLLEDFRAIAR
jgi:hypothetical protein